ncbi:MAG TPA: ABC transporter ATP-binding protein [Thermoguttaceae bacterium]|nr:ABC transporter ATP-binding protein [Thermoguttaceae bacterium]
MLSIHNIVAAYGKNVALQNVSAEISGGEFLGLIGPNGSGKTTLLRVVSGVLLPREGHVQLRNTNLRDVERRQLAKIMAFLSQDVTLDFSFTVREVVLMGRSPHLSRIGWETSEDLEIAKWAMALTGVAGLADRIVTELSGGERQKAFIAMCLAQQPELLLLDEPTNHLDIAHQLSALDLIRVLNRQTGMTVVSVFHDLNLAAEYCDRLIMLSAGRVTAVGTPEEILTKDMIHSVYGARVFVRRNPVSDKPHIGVSAGMNGSEIEQDVTMHVARDVRKTGVGKCDEV